MNKYNNFLGIFSSSVRTALLVNFFLNEEEEFYIRELARKLEFSVGNVDRELKNLEKNNILTCRSLGKSLFYKVNKDHPLFQQLKDIISQTVGIQKYLKDCLLGESSIPVAFIYGSYARNEFDASSDVDIFIVADETDGLYERVNRAIASLEKKFSREINIDFIAPAEYIKKKASGESYIKDILKNDKIFIKGTKDEL